MTQTDYENRMEKVVDYIYDHLEEDISLNRLADVACLSAYHWHRVYVAMRGETVATTVKRLRLQRAADRLANSDLSMKAIAKRAGYASVEAFSRGFSDLYTQTPAAYRRAGSHAKYKAAIAADSIAGFDVVVEKITELRCASVSHQGSYMQIDQAMGVLFSTLGSRGMLNENTRMGAIFYDDPAVVSETELRARACVPVDAEVEITSPLEEVTLTTGKYVRLRYQGPYADMSGAYNWLYGTWLPQSEFVPANTPVFEEYLNNPQEVDQTELLTDIFLPLEETI